MKKHLNPIYSCSKSRAWHGGGERGWEEAMRASGPLEGMTPLGRHLAWHVMQ